MNKNGDKFNKKPTVFVMNGSGRAGKDTFCKYAMQYLNNKHRLLTINISSVDEIKAYGKHLGWDGKKDAKGRKFLSDLKELSTRYDGPMKYMSKYIDNGADVVFVHIREIEEIEKFIDKYPDAITVLVRRGESTTHGNVSDDNVEDYIYDTYVYNNGTEDELKELAEELMKYHVVSFT